jgi:UDP-N-acetylglucosamine diphosphorylase / glucose-1-phosphate thymidylyltransferase / UDP-N-acetylgalactosamine diphosphorylase / glucosamine-1-phosphate N-acetyltransferase / galactosamine-1-phosphate N-acetyltransferase
LKLDSKGSEQRFKKWKNNMQAVILCAGASSRFYPLNCYTHKANVPLLGKPIYEHTIESIKRSGITDIVVVIGKDNFVKEKLGNGEKLGVTIRYSIQEEPRGMGDALLKAKDVLDDKFFVLHAHHIDFAEHKDAMMEKSEDVVLLAKEESDVTEFGVLKIENDHVTDIVEKPKKGEEPSKLRLIGLYLLNKKFIVTLEASGDDHYNFEKALATFAKENEVGYVTTAHKVVTLKYPWHLLDINELLLKNVTRNISQTAKISNTATIEGEVVVEDGVTINDGAIIKGPAYIGKNAFIGDNVILRNNVTIDENVVVGANMEIKNSIILESSTCHAGYIADSVIGPENKISGFFVTANTRLDREPVIVDTAKGEINSYKKHLGVITGKNVNIGARVTAMPGIIIGNDALIGPNTTVTKNITDNTKFYTKFQEVVESKNGEKRSEKIDSNKVVLFDIDYTLFNTKVFKESALEDYQLYEEALDVLTQLKNNVILGIFSEGELDFQFTKLQRTDINAHFLDENIHIVKSKDEKLREVLAHYRDNHIIIVDDKLTVLHQAKTLVPNITTIWVKRGMYAENQKQIPGFKADVEVDSLQEIPKIIQSL